MGTAETSISVHFVIILQSQRRVPVQRAGADTHSNPVQIQCLPFRGVQLWNIDAYNIW